MPCGGCNKKKKVTAKMPADYHDQAQYRNNVMKNFMASRRELIEKRK